MRFIGIVTIGISLCLAAKAGAFELRLNCKTTDESLSLLSNDFKVLDHDDTIYRQNEEILISDNEFETDFGWFTLVKCLKATTIITDEEIKAQCLDIRTDEGGYKLNMGDTSWSVKVNRYSGRLKAQLRWLRSTGERSLYLYEGICKASKKKLF